MGVGVWVELESKSDLVSELEEDVDESLLRLRPKDGLREMIPWATLRFVLLLDANHSKDHSIELQDIIHPVHPKLGASVAAHTPEMQQTNVPPHPFSPTFLWCETTHLIFVTEICVSFHTCTM